MLALVFGVIAYGAYLGIAHSVQDAAGQAARAAVGGLDADERIGLANDAVQRAIAANPLLDATNMLVAARSDPNDRDRFLITLTYDLSKTVVGAVPAFIPLPRSVARTASVRRGGL